MHPGFRNGFTGENSASSSGVTADNFDSACPSMAWTDEKHRLYLDSLEADFVKKLHHSVDSRKCSKAVNVHCSPQQRNHFKSPSNKDSASSQDFEHGASSYASSLEQNPEMHLYDGLHGSLGSNTEVSDQNFVDENVKVEEKPKGKSKVKRSRSNWRL